MVRANQLDNALEKPRVGGRASSTCLWTREFPNCSPCSCTTDQSAAELDTARVIDNVSTRQTRQTRVDLLCTFRCSCESSKHTFREMFRIVRRAPVQPISRRQSQLDTVRAIDNVSKANKTN